MKIYMRIIGYVFKYRLKHIDLLLGRMLISEEDILSDLRKYNKTITGVLHIGAHDCEEIELYRSWKIPDSNVIWIEALPDKVAEAQARGIPNVFHEAIYDKDDESIAFKRTNNTQASSILDLEMHKIFHPDIDVIETIPMKTKTIDTFMMENSFDRSKYNFWNFDIQGAEFMALKGGEDSLKYADVLYLEINIRELYKGCVLLPDLDSYLQTHGFIRTKIALNPAGWGDALYIRV